MDKITHEVRLANWKTVIEQCQNRTQGTTVKQWLDENEINDKTYYYWLRRVRQEVYAQRSPETLTLPEQPAVEKSRVAFAEIPMMDEDEASNQVTERFKADVVIRSGSTVIGISNSISDSLLTRILEVTHHAR